WAGDPAAAHTILEGLVRSQPLWAQAHFELGQTLSALAEEGAALAALREATRLKPDFADAWRAQGDLLVLAGDGAGADQAYAQHIKASVNDTHLVEAALALCDNRLPIAERLLREHLKAVPTDVAAIRMLAEVGTRLGRYGDAENLLARCLELAPSFAGARHNYATVLYRQNKAAEAIPHIEWLLQREPRNPGYRNLMAAALGLVGEYGRAIALYEQILAEHADQPKVWLSYGHALKTAGRQADAVEAYQRCVRLAPGFGEAYWSLANLKTVRFSGHEVEAMSAKLQRTDLEASDRFHLHYSLGKALEDAGDDARAFEHYAEGARLRRAEVSYDAEETTEHLRRSRALFTPAFFAERARQGCGDAAPIFVLGLPRSGSTLIEQILASHSAVEGTMELPEIVAMARTLGREAKDGVGYPEVLADLDAAALADLGQSFIERTRIQRKSGKPFFIDKMPNNVLHVGLIHLILPNAKIIDARRHPMGACFSAFKQHFARGQHYSYDLTEVGRYYRDYVELMAHFDAVLPGRIHRVIYEQMVEDTEGEIRRLLDYCGLPFEDGCLRFYENDRAVRTASSEQVRRPIFRDGLDQWRRFERWLGPLKTALGPLVETDLDIPSDRPGVGES
ncbi:MAG TPA: sulfotransferase, partial [Caulobacteraceae bacterium]|nr:sulfotransferase [Caulobacteraceae bacterium]